MHNVSTDRTDIIYSNNDNDDMIMFVGDIGIYDTTQPLNVFGSLSD